MDGWIGGGLEGDTLGAMEPSDSKNPNTCEEASNTSKTTCLVQIHRGRRAVLESVKTSGNK